MTIRPFFATSKAGLWLLIIVYNYFHPCLIRYPNLGDFFCASDRLTDKKKLKRKYMQPLLVTKAVERKKRGFHTLKFSVSRSFVLKGLKLPQEMQKYRKCMVQSLNLRYLPTGSLFTFVVPTMKCWFGLLSTEVATETNNGKGAHRT